MLSTNNRRTGEPQVMISMNKVRTKASLRTRTFFTWVIMVMFVTGTVPVAPCYAENSGGADRRSKTAALPAFDSKALARIKTGPHKLVPHAVPRLSNSPTDLELESARVFQEPLTPVGGISNLAENRALATAITSFKKNADPGNFSDFDRFLAQFKNSRWRATIELNKGLALYREGYLSQALNNWRQSFQDGEQAKERPAKNVADRALAELVLLDARLGRTDELESYLKIAKGRQLLGSNEQKVFSARAGLFCMKADPGKSFKCGPYSLNMLRSIGKPVGIADPVAIKAASTPKGTNLAQVAEWAKEMGMHYQPAKRSAGAPIMVPSVLHYRLGHFAAIVAKEGNKYRIKDPTFGNDGEFCMSENAINSETDGYFLVPAGNLGAGWSAIDQNEAANVWGKGGALQADQLHLTGVFPKVPGTPPNNKQCTGGTCCSGPMAQASASVMQGTLYITDTPVGYHPPVGPSLDFQLSYNQLQANQPSTFTFTNFGADWSLSWLSYLTVDPSSGVATARLSSGACEVFKPNGTGGFQSEFYTHSALSSPVSGTYNRQLLDGTIEVFNLSDTSSPPRYFLTQVIDPQNNSVLIQYDSNFRITSITDATNQVTTFSYVSNTPGNSGFYVVSQITDPFGRSASFSYDATNTYLLTITDIIGLQSKFVYDTSSSFITAMTTPYGTTSFSTYKPTGLASSIGLRFSFPDGTSSVIENWMGTYMTTYFWDREAMALYPNDPGLGIHTHSRNTTYCLDASTETEVPQVTAVQPPLDNATTYSYPGQTSYLMLGTSSLPNEISQPVNAGQSFVVTIGGTVTTGDILTIAGSNYTVQSSDTLATIATGLTNAINANPHNSTMYAASIGNAVYLNARFGNVNASNSKSPGATETFTFSYQLRTVGVFPISGTVTPGDQLYITVNNNLDLYIVQAGDTLATIATGLAAAVQNDLYLGNKLTSVASGTTVIVTSNEQLLLQPEVVGSAPTESMVGYYVRNGWNIMSDMKYNPLGYITQKVDPAGRVFSYTYGSNNIDLDEIRETQLGGVCPILHVVAEGMSI